MIDHDAAMRVYPQIVEMLDDEAWDADGNPVEIDAALVEEILPTIQNERDFQYLREQRNRKLSQTDWSGLSDVTMSDEMRTYRQALRDLPANTTDPANPVWPTKP